MGWDEMVYNRMRWDEIDARRGIRGNRKRKNDLNIS